MRAGLKLVHQGLILAAVPLAFQLFFIGVLYHALYTAETDFQRAEHAKEMIAHTDLVPKLIKADNVFWVYRLTGNERLRDEYDTSVSAIKSDIAALDQLIGGDPRQEKELERIKHTVGRMITVIETERKAMNPADREERFRYSSRFRDMGTRLSWEIEELIGRYRKVEAPDQRQFRQHLKNILLVVVVANILIAVGLALAFNKSTLQRLKVLMSNTKRFGQARPLLPMLEGRDELAELDRFFHEMAADVESANRMKREFTAMITHDIRTPLTSMQGLLNLISRGAYGDQLSPKSRSSLEAVDQELQRLIKLINDLLDVERLESGKMEMHFDLVPVAYVLEQSFQAVRGMADLKKIAIEIPDSDLHIFADGDRLVQVLVNLLANAIRFSPEEGKIAVALRDTDLWLEVRVIDQGPGIPNEAQQRIFDRFRQAAQAKDSKRSGAGLGLAICKDIVEAHRGTIGVDSEVGKGSEFWFRIPAGGQEAPPSPDTGK
jgi:signal transduction histidine kinase